MFAGPARAGALAIAIWMMTRFVRTCTKRVNIIDLETLPWQPPAVVIPNDTATGLCSIAQHMQLRVPLLSVPQKDSEGDHGR